MNKAQAIAKLSKVLGKNFGYRLDPKAKNADERAEAAARAKEVHARLKAVREAKEARCAAILAADAQYQQLSVDARLLSNEYDAQRYITLCAPITVGTTDGLFFSVRAEGDNWSEVVEKVCASKAPA